MLPFVVLMIYQHSTITGMGMYGASLLCRGHSLSIINGPFGDFLFLNSSMFSSCFSCCFFSGRTSIGHHHYLHLHFWCWQPLILVLIPFCCSGNQPIQQQDTKRVCETKNKKVTRPENGTKEGATAEN
jgi:hypothetical protein